MQRTDSQRNVVFIWNRSSCKCECDKSCDVGEYLDYENCKCRKRLIDKSVEECSENIAEKKLHSNEMIYNTALNDYVCTSFTVYIVLFAIYF